MWRDAARAEDAANALRITAHDLLNMGIVDEIVPEPEGGAHHDPEGAARLLEPVLARMLETLMPLPTETLLRTRYEKFRRMGNLSIS